MKRTYVEINLNTLRYNIQKIKGLIGSKVQLMGIVKADGYGHGAVQISKVLEEEGAGYLGVAWTEEGIELRKKGVNLPILILSEQDESTIPDIVEYNLSQTVYSLDFARKLSDYCKNSGKTCKVHIKMDTGMGRVGIYPEKVEEFVLNVKKLPNLTIEGLFTHFSKADEPESEYTIKQFESFIAKARHIKENILNIPYLHSANSAALYNYPETHLDMVRIGIALYKNVLQFKTKIGYIKETESGTLLGYGGTYVTKNKTKIATLPVGYADGYNRLLSNNSNVLIKGKKYPIVGRVSMDMIMVDIGIDSEINIADDVVLIGESNSQNITAEEIAQRCQTIDYEILCSIGKRVPRYYLNEKKMGCALSGAASLHLSQ